MKVPVCDATQRLALLFGRKALYHWSEKEGKAYLKLAAEGFYDDPEKLDRLERYYAFERKRGDKGLHRRDLFTYLNNAHGENDRAVLWGEAHPLKRAASNEARKPPEPEWDADKAAATKEQLAGFRRDMRGPTKCEK